MEKRHGIGNSSPFAKKTAGQKPGQVQQGGYHAITPTRPGEPARNLRLKEDNTKFRQQCALIRKIFWLLHLGHRGLVAEMPHFWALRPPTDSRRFP